MVTSAIKPGSAEGGAPAPSGKVDFLRSAARRLRVWKQELGVLRDRRIYADFSSPAYQHDNIARLQHLDSLGLELAGKNVLELGAAIGDHTLFYLFRNCRILAVEGRLQLAKKLSERLGVKVVVIVLDREPEKLEQLRGFDFVHCYGLLYHLSDPGRFLSAVSRAGDCLLLETCISAGEGVHVNRCREPSSMPSQALNGEGCRPTREWVFRELERHYEYVYATRTQPRHPEFPIDWTDPSLEGQLLKRAVFIASHTPIINPNLVAELPSKQANW